MLRLLGFLSLGHLLFGGRRHSLRRGLLLGALLGYLASRDFDAEHAAHDVRKAARNAQRTARDAVRAVKREVRKAEHDRKAAEIHEKIHARKAEREERLNAVRQRTDAVKEARSAYSEPAVQALPASGTKEAKVIRELAEDLERDARKMAAHVPTIDFPDEDGKYFSSVKYACNR